MARLTRVEQVPKEVTYAYRCDNCGREGTDLTPTHSGNRDPAPGWVSFTSHHDEWGNDSVESHDSHDVCSFHCYVAVVRHLLSEWEGYPTLEIDDKDRCFMEGMVADVPEASKA